MLRWDEQFLSTLYILFQHPSSMVVIRWFVQRRVSAKELLEQHGYKDASAVSGRGEGFVHA